MSPPDRTRKLSPERRHCRDGFSAESNKAGNGWEMPWSLLLTLQGLFFFFSSSPQIINHLRIKSQLVAKQRPTSSRF